MSDPNQVVIHNLQGPGLLEFAPDAETLAQRIAEARPVALPMLKGPPPHPKKNHELKALVGSGSPSSAIGGTPIAGEPPLQGNGPQDTSPSPLSTFPFVAVGRLYATRTDSQGHSITTFGTAWSCGGSVAMTAGHCVFTQADGWPTSVVFVPHFDPTQPLGAYWNGIAIAAVGGWVNSNQQTDADYQYDLAAIRSPPRWSRRSARSAGTPILFHAARPWASHLQRIRAVSRCAPRQARYSRKGSTRPITTCPVGAVAARGWRGRRTRRWRSASPAIDITMIRPSPTRHRSAKRSRTSSRSGEARTRR